MTDSNQELKLLERVTSRVASPGPVPPGDEPELREGWETLVQLATRANAGREFDEQAFLAKISTSVAKAPAVSRGSWLLVFAALAASVIAAVVSGGYLASRNWSPSNVARGVNPPRERSDQPSSLGQGEDGSRIAWDDTLDEQIDYLRLTVHQFKSGASAGDRSLEALSVQLEQFGNEIENGSL